MNPAQMESPVTSSAQKVDRAKHPLRLKQEHIQREELKQEAGQVAVLVIKPAVR